MNFKTKLLAVAVLPVILISLASYWAISNQSQTLAQTQIAEVEERTMAARRAELQKMNQLALNAIRGLYEDTTLPDFVAQDRAKKMLHNMAFGEDGYFFVYDETGTNIVHPRLPELVGKNWWDLQDPNGDFVIRNLIDVAKAGGGFHEYVWNKPSTGELANKVGHAVFLDKWKWMIGTGLYTDDVEAEVATMRASLSASINQTTSVLLILFAAGILLAALFTWAIRLSEQRFANERLKDLTHRIVEVQEDERKRVSKELHDGISQMLVSARYGLDSAMANVGKTATAKSALAKSMTTIENAIAEVRRISMALRPSVLDDIGLAAAIASLGREFGDSSGIHVASNVVRLENRVSSKAQTALYRVAQEALTNIAKHAQAQNVWITLRPDSQNVVLTIEDDGSLRGDVLIKKSGDRSQGMGLRNMRERMDAFQGQLDIRSSKYGGLVVEARVPINPEWVRAQNDNAGTDNPRAA
ncbi:MAG: cache domain-containing protein [Rhizobiaceae bacterium]